MKKRQFEKFVRRVKIACFFRCYYLYSFVGKFQFLARLVAGNLLINSGLNWRGKNIGGDFFDVGQISFKIIFCLKLGVREFWDFLELILDWFLEGLWDYL